MNPILKKYTKEPLWGHQAKAIETADELFEQGKSGIGFFMGMGSGKTLTTLAYAQHIDARTILIVCPSNVLHDGVWLRDNKRLLNPFQYILNLTKGSSDKKGDLVYSFMSEDFPYKVVITNYRSIWRRDLGVAIRKQHWDLIVTDEIQHIKSAGSTQSKYMATMERRSFRRLGLTGTPIHDSPMDVYGIFRFLDPSVFGTRLMRFQDQYAVMHVDGRKRFPVAFRNLDQLRDKMNDYAYYVDSEDVLDLPEDVHIVYKAPLVKLAKQAYKQLKQDSIAFFENGGITIDNVLAQITRLQQITSGYLPLDNDATQRFTPPKIHLMEDILDKMPRIISNTRVKRQPVVIVYKYKEDRDNIIASLFKMKITYSVYDGGTDDLEQWKLGQTTALVAQYAKVKEGISLTRATHMILYSKLFSYGDYQQLLKRIRRPIEEGYEQENISRDRVYYHHLVVQDTIDEDIEASLVSKASVADYIIEKLREVTT